MPVIKFQTRWKHDFPWVKEGRMKFTADCAWCNTSFAYDTMGRAALTSHAKGKKHLAMAGNQENTLPINKFWQVGLDKSNTSSEAQATVTPSTSLQTMNISDNNISTSTQNNSTLERFKLKDSVTEAEIMWCISTVMNHNSLRNAESSVLLFSKMFKGSTVAKEMKLHKDKIAYSIVFGLAPYFKNLLKLSIMNGSHYVIGFDESFNKIAQRTQMDLMIRFWDSSCNAVKSRYLGSVFLNQCKATDLLEAFKNGIADLDSSKLLQISMDGPNVNWAFLKLVKHDLNASLGPDAPQLLELGSCGLHIVHGAFKTGMNKTEWSIVQFLRALYNLFKMVPARRGQFVEITSSALFPHQFCTIRWIENSKVAKRAIEMLPNVKKYVEAVKGTSKEPTCNSFKVVEKALADNLLPAKLAFFQSLAEKLEPFLREFQSDSPMVPFLYESLQNVLKEVMIRFVKREIMIKDSFFKVDVFEKEDKLYKSLMKVTEIDLGYGTRSSLRICKNVTEKDIISFRKEIRTCYQFLVSKIQEKSPLKYPLTKAMSFLNPSSIARDESQAFKDMEKAFDIMIQSNVIAASDAEQADREYKEIVCQPHFKIKAEQYSRKEERVDQFWVSEICKTVKLKEVVKKCLVLSHGNATLERGFSVNKEILAENMREESLVAQRIIHDAVSDAGGLEKWSDLPIPKQLIHYMRNSYSRFKEAEEHRKKTMTEKDLRAAEKRKANFQLKELEEKRKKTLEKMKEELFTIDQEMKKIKS